MSMNSPESAPAMIVKTVDEVLRQDQQTFESVPAFVGELIESYSNDDEYRANLAQLQRLARLVTNPHPLAELPPASADGFYWGSVLGMTAGDYYFGPRWSEILYKSTNAHMAVNRANAIYHSIESAQQLPTTSQAAIDTANLFLGLFESEEYALPDAYQELINEWTPQISTDASQQYYFEAGFNFVFNIALSQTQHEALAYQFAQIVEQAPESYAKGFATLDKKSPKNGRK